MDRFLITGFSGFVSYFFLSFLNSINDTNVKIEVLGLDLLPPVDFEQAYIFENLSVNFLSLNLSDENKLTEVLTTFKPNYVLHLASLSSVGASWKDPNGSFINNTGIFLTLAEAVRKSKIQCRILSIGSSEEYGIVDKTDLPLTEESKLNPISPYAIARVAQEMLSKCYVDSYGLDIVLTRSFNHIGSRQKDCFVVPSFIKQILTQKKNGREIALIKTGDLSIIRDFLDVRDVVSAYYSLLKLGKSGEVYNVCNGNGYSLNEIITVISELLEIPVHTELDENLIRPNDNPVIVGSNEKIQKLTSWKPKYSLRDTISEMITYWNFHL